jgi:hypothetical protein
MAARTHDPDRLERRIGFHHIVVPARVDAGFSPADAINDLGDLLHGDDRYLVQGERVTLGVPPCAEPGELGADGEGRREREVTLAGARV